MGRDKLRQPSRPPPAFDPFVESWLDGLPPSTTKPSAEELAQWRLDERGGVGRDFFITSVVLRVLSLIFAATVTGLVISIVALQDGDRYAGLDRLIPVLVVCPIIILWNAAEFVTLCWLSGRGISFRIHVWADGLLFLGAAIATGFLLVDVVMGLGSYDDVLDTASKEIASACLLILVTILHTFLFFFFICNCLDRREKKKTKPRVMYLPTGQAVLVTSQPVAAQPAIGLQQLPTEMGRPKNSSASLGEVAIARDLKGVQEGRKGHEPHALVIPPPSRPANHESYKKDGKDEEITGISPQEAALKAKLVQLPIETSHRNF
ncbi:hypothetical protein B0H63DRAFT_305801 [Podospora didyma]|uniref:Uncharacterized protein n=1 Tax=Podospora didyma TaxID=330526 RepID=A0AAE0K5J1_9PEZI|nr:hypothetical protein B0H63DRAFT_305801 [Podospora didyma]